MIFTLSLIRASLKNLTVHRLRSFLTILSMVFGTGAVIATLNSNEGAQAYINKQLQTLGTNLLRIESKGAEITLNHLEIIRSYSDLLKSSVIEKSLGQKQFRTDSKLFDASVYGVSRNYFQELDLNLDKGRIFDGVEEKIFSATAVIGSRFKNDLFGKHNAIGKQFILVNDGNSVPIRVIGVLKEKGSQFGNVDTSIFLNLNFAKKVSLQGSQTTIIGIMKEGVQASDAKKQVSALLQPRLKGKFGISDARETIEKTKSIWEKQNLLGICLASVSLLTGGVGIMNIMLLSIHQRRREIGLRKAIGARPTDISLQFLVEAATVCFLGGVLGVLFGSFFGNQVAKMLGDWEAVTSFKTIGLALIVSTLTGIIFGLLPALRASKLDPYEALRG